MKGQSAIEHLMTYGWMLLVVAIVGAAIFVSVQKPSQEPEPAFNKSQVMKVVERGAGQECEWVNVNPSSGRIDCVQEFTWNNQSYRVHDYFDVSLVNDTIEITQ